MDAKATAIVTHVTSGTGLLALGTLAAIYGAKVPPAVALCALPAMILAVLAVRDAARARRPMGIVPPPLPEEMILLAEREPGDRGRAHMIPQWQWCAELMRVPVAEKGRLVDRATWSMIASVAMLVLPVLAAAVVRPVEPAAQSQSAGVRQANK